MNNISPAAHDDLESTLKWLQCEYEEDGEGFWANQNIITKAYEDHELFVLKVDGLSVAALVGGDTGIDILTVKKEYRGTGLGKQLAQFAIEKIRSNDICVITIRCAPTTSVPFWEQLGFKRNYCSDEKYITASLVLEHKHDLPSGAKKEDVVVKMYSEHALRNPEATPLKEWKVNSIRSEDGRLILEKRIVFFHAGRQHDSDLVAEIIVNGKTLIRDKVKYDEMSNFGMDQADCGTYYLAQTIQ